VKTEKLENVIKVTMDVRGAGWEQWFLLSSDRHHDSPDCNRELEIEHLEECKKRKGYVLDFGDIFDAMQGRYDPRRTYKDIRPEYQKKMIEGGKFLDVIVKDAVNFYKPYANQILLIGRGNHETAIETHNDTDLIDRLVSGINTAAKSSVYSGFYGGWVRFMFKIQGTQRESVNMKYFHGAGGGGPVTKGTIQSNRQAVFLPDADIVVNGHIHESWVLAIPRERLSDAGVVYQDLQFHVRTATYKNDYGNGSSGWHIETGKPPKPRGAVWLRFYLDRSHIRTELIPCVV
jgi:hypothetical protein